MVGVGEPSATHGSSGASMATDCSVAEPPASRRPDGDLALDAVDSEVATCGALLRPAREVPVPSGEA